MKHQTILASPEAIISHFVDRSPWVYWDEISAYGGEPLPNEITPFSIPLGMMDPLTGALKRRHNTNMISSGPQYGFGGSRCLILEEMGIYFPLWLSDSQIDVILSAATLEVSICEKRFFEHRFDLEEIREIREPGGSTIEANIMPEELKEFNEQFDHAAFSERTIRITSPQQFRRYIAPKVPFTFAIRFENPPTLEFEGIRPVMVAVMRGLTDRAVQ
jgi:hypothetical protein